MRRNLLSSPTIHASLDDELNKSGLDNDDFYEASSENLHDAVKIQGCDMNGNNDESFATAFTTPSITKVLLAFFNFFEIIFFSNFFLAEKYFFIYVN